MSDLSHLRIGTGFDVHAFAPERALVLGGVTISYKFGLLGYSDADVLTHALMDALLSAARMPDIGELFPDTNEANQGASSLTFLEEVVERVHSAGFCIIDCDCVLVAEKPKLAPYKEEMRERLAHVLECEISQIGIKSTTSEKLGFAGRQEGIAAFANVLLEKVD